MAAHAFSISEALRFGWNTLKRNLGFSIAIGAAFTVIILLLNGLTQATDRYPGLAMGLGLLSQLVQIVFSLVWIRFAITVHDGRAVNVQELVPDSRTFLNYVAVSILLGLMVFVGLILLVVPGIYLGVRYGLAGFAVADAHAEVLEAFHRSSELTRGARGRLLVLGLALFALNLVGALAFGIGLMFTVPISAFAMAFVYRRLASRLAALSEGRDYAGSPYPAPSVV